jgi:hypothetical protein
MSMQKKYKDHRSFWFIDQVREYILALEDDHDISSPFEGRKKSVLNAAQASSSGSSSTDDLSEVVSKLAGANVVAIVTKAETSSRDKNSFNKRNERPYDAKMGPCRFCGGSHRHHDCHTLIDNLSEAPYPSMSGSSERSLRQRHSGFPHGSRRSRPALLLFEVFHLPDLRSWLS